ncbi:glutaredoxin family protein [uncultured Phycicoccus sp.]|uniref:glutaredoxin family protein n=1 Tax=uncultured Phycicoccus sp. TaxID=661422 RepID=UPI0026342A8F|nr:glutaredoxin family protein [uncultured Phycicoccus sp.]
MGAGQDPPRVTLVVRPGCHLCIPAREVVERVCADLGERWEEIDVDSDASLAARWSEEVPVTLVDGRQHDFWRVDETRLRAALAAPARPRPDGAPGSA